ncbi:MAG: peptidase MA family metallohydrolase [Candidatus Limnocylindrales bacterium]
MGHLMNAGRRPRPLVALAIAAALGALLALPQTRARAADTVHIAGPSASGTLGSAITYRDTFQATSTPVRVELLLQDPGVYGELVLPASVTPVAGGYDAEVVDDSHVIPNTTVDLRFRVITTAGATVGPSATFTMQDDRYTWQTMTGTHVRLHWYSGSQAFAQKALKVGDDAVTRVATLLGVPETQPIDFFVYASADGLDAALGPGTSEFVAGRAVPEIRTLFAEIDPDQSDTSWVTTVVPHELTHLVFDTATHNPYHEPPLWLNEGLAVYESIGDDADDQGRVRDAVASGTLLPLTGLTGAFPVRQDLFYLSYAEAVSAVDFFVHTYGQAHLVQLIRSYAPGVTDDEAFKAAAGVDVAGFQAAWLANFHGSLAAAYGPRAPAQGSLPPGWSALGQVAGSGIPTTAPGLAAPTVAPLAGGDALASALDEALQPAAPLGPVAVVLIVVVALVLLARRRRSLVRSRMGDPPAPPPGPRP